jgi:hypothetical protein
MKVLRKEEREIVGIRAAKTKPRTNAGLVNLQPFFYGRSVNPAFCGAAHEKDKFKTGKRCLGLTR